MADKASLAKQRGRARRCAMQAIYQWQMTSDDVTGIAQQYIEENSESSIDVDYFSELFLGVAKNADQLDKQLEQYMDRLASSVDPVDRAILSLACYELIYRMDVPYRVVINEAVTLAKKFCTEKSHTFVNGVLDKVAHQVRAVEINAAHNK